MQQELEQFSLDEYLEMAIKFVKKNTYGRTRSQILQSNEALGCIANRAMVAAKYWRVDGGSSLRGFMKRCMRQGVYEWANKQKQNFKRHKYTGDYDYENFIPDNRSEKPIHDLEENQHVLDIFSKCNLTDHQRDILTKIFVEQYSQSDVAKELCITPQAVHLCVKKALSKVKQYLYGVQ